MRGIVIGIVVLLSLTLFIHQLNGSENGWQLYTVNNTSITYDITRAIFVEDNGTVWYSYRGEWNEDTYSYTGGGLIKMVDEEWTIYSMENSGLPSNYIRVIESDGSGNLWIGTQGGGTAVFDGNTWVIYNTENSDIPSDRVTDIQIDDDGNIWFATWGGGIAKLDRNGWTIFNNTNSGLPHNDVWTICFDYRSNLWVGTRNGLARFDGNNWDVYTISNSGLHSNGILSLAISKENIVWAGTYGYGLSEFDGENWKTYRYWESGLQSDFIMSLVIENDNLWIGTDEGINRFNGFEWEYHPIATWALTMDNDGNLWAAYEELGVGKYDGTKWTRYSSMTTGLPSNIITSLAIDEMGSVWIGTSGGGLAVYDGINWFVYNWLTGVDLSMNLRRNSIAFDSKGNVWIAGGESLFKFDGLNWEKYNHLNSGLPIGGAIALTIDNDDNVWIKSNYWYGGVYLYALVKFDVNHNKWTIYDSRNTSLPNRPIMGLEVDCKNIIWIIIFDNGLVKFDGKNEWHFYNTLNSNIPSNRIETISIDQQDNIWLGFSNSLVIFDQQDTWTVYDHNNSDIPAGNVSSIDFDSKGRVWVGVYGMGVVLIDGDNWVIYDLDRLVGDSDFDGFNNIRDISIDKNDTKWIGTNNGLISLNGALVNVPNETHNILARMYTLEQNYPNPFNPTTIIRFTVPEKMHIKITVYDILGRIVEVLVNEEKSAGQYSINFQADHLSSGIYIYSMETEAFKEFKKMILMR